MLPALAPIAAGPTTVKAPAAASSRAPRAPRRPVIRVLGHLLLLVVVTLLAAIGGWAGLSAWSTPLPAVAGEVPDVALPEPVTVDLPPFPRPAPRAVEASVELRSGAVRPTGTVSVAVTGTRSHGGPDRIALLDGATGVVLAEQPIPDHLPATLELEGVPIGTHRAVAYRAGESPRWRYTVRVPVELAAAPGEPRATLALDVTTERGIVVLELLEVPAERSWVPVTGILTRVGDPDWTASPGPGTRASFEPGSADLVLEFGELGIGRYELRVVGFEPLEPIVFDVPGDDTVFATGRTG